MSLRVFGGNDDFRWAEYLLTQAQMEKYFLIVSCYLVKAKR